MNMIRYSQHSGYDVSSKGDRRFSPEFNRTASGQSIQWHLENEILVKHGKNFSDEAYAAYYNIWRRWAERNYAKMAMLADLASRNDNTIRDSVTTGQMTHARVLAQLLNERAEAQQILRQSMKKGYNARQRQAV